MTTTSDLIAELKEKKKGCGNSLGTYNRGLNFKDEVCGGNWEEYYYEDGDHTHRDDQWVITLCPTCQAEITALQKGIDACDDLIKKEIEFLEEIYNQSYSRKTDELIIEKLNQLKAEIKEEAEK